MSQFVVFASVDGVNSQAYTLQTLNDVEQNLATIPIPADDAVIFNIQVVGVYPDSTLFGIGWAAIVTNDGGVGALIVDGAPDQIWEISSAGAGGTAALAVVGSNLQINVTGEIATTINWKAIVSNFKQSAP
jgi:hypothetical protein